MTDRCNHPIELLVAYSDGELPEAERTHIDACPDCQTRLQGLQHIAATLQATSVPVDETALTRSIQTRIALETRAGAAQQVGSFHSNGHAGDFPLINAARPAVQPQRARHRRLREVSQFVAAGLAIALVASLLVVLFRDSGAGDGDSERAGASSPTIALPVGAATDAPVRLIAWANDVYGDGAFKIVVGDTAGATPAKLMGGPFFKDMSRERSPVWSPDGSMIAVVTDRDGNDEIYALSGNRPGSLTDPNATGLDVLGPRNATNDPGSDSDPNWSPDSKWIAFSSRREDNLDIYVTQVGSVEATRLTTGLGADSDPAWSPDGMQIAYRSERRDGSGAFDIMVMNVNGSEQRRVSAHLSAKDGINSSPVWSPDGSFLAFTTILYSATDGAAERILTNVVGVETGGTYTITDDPYPVTDNPSQAVVGWESVDWSPDGAFLIFPRPVDNQFDLAIASPDGSNLTMLSNSPDNDEIAPRWSPEGTEILYVRLPHSSAERGLPPAELRVVEPTGANNRMVAALTVDAALASRPAWGPLASEAGEPYPDLSTPDTSPVSTPTRVAEPPTPTPVAPIADASVCEHRWPLFPSGIFVMNADGSNQRLVLHPETSLSHISWSPDGRELIGLAGGSVGIVSVTADSTDVRWISSGDDSHFNDVTWSPDGANIAYIQSSEASAIYIAEPDGSNARMLTSRTDEIVSLAWSPDGSRIAFSAIRGGVSNIFTIAVDGTGEQQITDSVAGADRPAWSADGSSIRYMSEVDDVPGDYALDFFEIDLESSVTRQLAIFEEGDIGPVWSPDDSRIAFMRDGNVWSMAADGTDQRNLTQYPIWSSDPVWSPDGQQILFTSHRVHWQPARDVEGQPERIVLWHGESSQSGGGGRWCQRNDSGMEAHDVVGVVVPDELMSVPEGATVDLVVGALGTPTAISVDIYDLTVAEQLGQVQDGTLVPPCRPEERCHVQSLTFVPAPTQSLTLDLPPGRYVLAVRVNFESTTGRGYSEQGFSIVVE